MGLRCQVPGGRGLAIVLCPVLIALSEVCGRLWVHWRLGTGPLGTGPHGKMVAAPIDTVLAQQLAAMPRPNVTEEQRRLFQEDGFIVLEGLMANSIVMDTLRRASQSSIYALNCLPVNGPMLSLARDSPLGSVVSQLLGGIRLRVWSGNFFHKETLGDCLEDPKVNPFSKCDVPHLDLDAEADSLLPFASAWVAFTEANHSIGLIAGTHTANHTCGFSDATPNFTCLVKLTEDLARLRGRPSVLSYDLKPGDVIIFYNQLLHYTKEDTQTPKRAAASIRYIAADHGFGGPVIETNDIVMFRSRHPRQCTDLGNSPLFPLADAPQEVGQAPLGWPVMPRVEDLATMDFWGAVNEYMDYFTHCPKA
eukprot:CAMPEP_0204587066 /NCGR_PEP_ID=MMETSP0661-20131031/47841_1 /ASSEMBLY_ACC=CAM_ASM_000606 /TAXON_ID=109239 /ORGANISM="Alexandrium margalefi, Strain AMGDE01CS-322" /LENGTH=363 /DNA_ID=CAMNT_0051596751 /DNA_START=44 /DNA_END=1135 /DNA_ORIENTATION=+